MTAATHSFETLFDQSPHVVAHAAGVAPLAGDLRDGRPSLTISTPLAMHMLVARRRDPVVHAASANEAFAHPARMVYVLGEEHAWASWVDYVQGVTLALREARHDIPGFDLLVRSDVPANIGLGTSTALVVALLRALRDAYALGFDDTALAALARRAESAFVPAPSHAAIDACVHATDRHVLLVDGRSCEAIALPDAMEATLLFGPHAASATEATETSELAVAARVEELAAALRAGVPEAIGALLDLMPGAQGELVATARRHPSVYGARCIRDGGPAVALVRRGEARTLRAA